MAVTGQLRDVLTEDRLIDAHQAAASLIDPACRDVKELIPRTAACIQEADTPPLFDWICNLLVSRRLSRGLAARLLTQLHQAN